MTTSPIDKRCYQLNALPTVKSTDSKLDSKAAHLKKKNYYGRGSKKDQICKTKDVPSINLKCYQMGASPAVNRTDSKFISKPDFDLGLRDSHGRGDKPKFCKTEGESNTTTQTKSQRPINKNCYPVSHPNAANAVDVKTTNTNTNINTNTNTITNYISDGGFENSFRHQLTLEETKWMQDLFKGLQANRVELPPSMFDLARVAIISRGNCDEGVRRVRSINWAYKYNYKGNNSFTTMKEAVDFFMKNFGIDLVIRPHKCKALGIPLVGFRARCWKPKVGKTLKSWELIIRHIFTLLDCFQQDLNDVRNGIGLEIDAKGMVCMSIYYKAHNVIETCKGITYSLSPNWTANTNSIYTFCLI